MVNSSETQNEAEEETPTAAPSDGEQDADEATDAGKKRRRRKRTRSRKKQKTADEDENENLGNDGTAKLEDDTGRTVFVEGIPYQATPDEVAQCICSCAGLERKTISDMRLPTWQDSGRLRGYGHIVFSETDSFNKVLKASSKKMWLKNRYLSVQPARAKRSVMPERIGTNNRLPTKTLWVKNLSYEATEDDIMKVMEKFGTVVSGGVRIARNFKTRQSKGFAYVEFEEMESAKKAIQQQSENAGSGKTLCILNRACILDYDEGRVKGSFKTSEGRLWSREYKQ